MSVLIKVHDGNVIFANTDLDNEVETIVATGCTEPTNAEIFIDLSTLKLITKSFNAKDPVSVDVTPDLVSFEQDEILQNIKCLDFEDGFPYMRGPEITKTLQFEFEAEVLLKILKSVAPCMSQEEARYYLNGIFMHSIHQNLSFVATDGHRLAKYETGKHTENFEGVIIQYQSIKLILKALTNAKKGETACLSTDELRIRFTVGDFALTTKAIDGTFPDYHRVIPKNTEFVEIKAQNLVRAIAPHKTRFKTIFGPYEKHPVKLNVNGSIEMTSLCDDERFEPLLTTETEIIRHTGEDTTLSLRIDLFSQAIVAAGYSKTENPTIRMAIVDHRSPITLHNTELPQLTQVLMTYNG